jgi:hypothetical protein
MPNSYYEDSDDEEASSLKNKAPNLPRFVKNSMDNISEDQIIINISKTQYEVVEIAA